MWSSESKRLWKEEDLNVGRLPQMTALKEGERHLFSSVPLPLLLFLEHICCFSCSFKLYPLIGQVLGFVGENYCKTVSVIGCRPCSSGNTSLYWLILQKTRHGVLGRLVTPACFLLLGCVWVIVSGGCEGRLWVCPETSRHWGRCGNCFRHTLVGWLLLFCHQSVSQSVSQSDHAAWTGVGRPLAPK